MDAITLDQMQVFVVVADEGSFSAAARRLGRAQSAVTYAVQKLEEQIGADLFDRSAYRPTLSEAGVALLPRARRVLEDVAGFRTVAHAIAGGLEAEVSLVVDSMFPMCRLVEVLADLQRAFPTVVPRLYVESLGAAPQMVIDGHADLGVVFDFATVPVDVLEHRFVADIELVAVCAPEHPLAMVAGPLSHETVRDHPQLVLTDRSPLTAGRDKGVFATHTWRLADLGAKHALLLAGLGWGSMPRHMVETDLAEGRLVALLVEDWDLGRGPPRLPVLAARRKDRVLGPAGRWLWERLVATPLSADGVPLR
jgi:DNA-binding transcriptional LysR family regulator